MIMIMKLLSLVSTDYITYTATPKFSAAAFILQDSPHDYLLSH